MAGYKYSYNFIEDLEDSFMCVICHDVVKRAKQHNNCGKLYCTLCIDQVTDRSCPHCREENPTYFLDKSSDTEIRNIPVRCTNAERGCRWTGTVGDLDNHMDTCDFTLVYCPNDCEQFSNLGCFDRKPNVMRKDLLNHISLECINRICKCKHCGKEEKYCHIEQHDAYCEKKRICCPNEGCEQEFEQADIVEHKKFCKYTEVECKYKELGCTVKKMRIDIAQHEENDDKVHLATAADTVDSLSKEVTTLQKKISLFEEVKNFQVVKPNEPLIFLLDKYRDHKAKEDSFESQPFYTSVQGYKVLLTVNLNSDYISVHLDILEGLYDQTLDWPFNKSIKVELLNQVGNYNHHEKICEFSPHSMEGSRYKQRSECNEFIHHSALESELLVKYLQNDRLYFRVSVNNDKPWLNCTI